MMPLFPKKHTEIGTEGVADRVESKLGTVANRVVIVPFCEGSCLVSTTKLLNASLTGRRGRSCNTMVIIVPGRP